MKRRSQSATERDLGGQAARRAREAAAPEFVDEEATGRYEGPDLQRIRERRPTPQRIARVEVRVDTLEKSVARMDGKLDAIVDYAARADAERERRSKAEADALERRRRYSIRLIKALGVVVVGIITALVGFR